MAIVCTPSYTVSGTVVGPGWGGSVVIQLNGGDDTTVVLPASGVSAPFTFSTALPIGTPYAVTVLQAPPYSPCAFFPNGQFQTSWTGPGTGNVTNVQVHCNGVLEGVGATVARLLPNQGVTVKTTRQSAPGRPGLAWDRDRHGYHEWPPATNARLTVFLVSTIRSPLCLGQVGETCTGDQRSTVGLHGHYRGDRLYTLERYDRRHRLRIIRAGRACVVLQDNGGNATTVSANGPFTFSAALANQSPYAVTVATQPVGEELLRDQRGRSTVPSDWRTSPTLPSSAHRRQMPACGHGSGANTLTAASFLGGCMERGARRRPAPAFPGGRGDAAFSWTDGAGNLWMFGGGGPGNSGVGGLFNDLWRFSPGTGLWAWMSGADTLGAQSVYSHAGYARSRQCAERA